MRTLLFFLIFISSVFAKDAIYYLSTMMNLDQNQYQLVQDTIESMADDKKLKIYEEFAKRHNDPYLAEVFFNLLDNPKMGAFFEKRLQNSILYAAPLLSEILKHKKDEDLNFAILAEFAKTHPEVFPISEFIIEDNAVYLFFPEET